MFEINLKNYNHKENFLEIVVLDILETIEETEEKNFIGGKCKITSPFFFTKGTTKLFVQNQRGRERIRVY